MKSNTNSKGTEEKKPKKGSLKKGFKKSKRGPPLNEVGYRRTE